jgi:hypothetical protein
LIVDNENVLIVETYSYWGKLHNDALSKVKDNFIIPEGDFSLSEKNDYIKNFNMEFLQSANINEFATQKEWSITVFMCIATPVFAFSAYYVGKRFMQGKRKTGKNVE